MGIFSEIGKGIKSVFKGLGKIFEPVLKPLGKVLSSGLGKAIMLAVSVFTLGTALMAGGQAFIGGQGFIGRFVDAGQAFMESLIGKSAGEAGKAGAEAGAETASGALVEGADIAGQQAADAMLQGGDKLGGGMGSGGAGSGTISGGNLGAEAMQTGTPEGLLTQGSELAETASGLPNAGSGLLEGGKKGMLEAAKDSGFGAEQAAQADKGWLSKAASAAKDFMSTEGGGRITGKVIGGIGAGMAAANRESNERRYDRMWRDQDNSGIRELEAQNYDSTVDAGRGMGVRNAAGGQRFIRNTRRTPTVPFRN